MIGDYFRYLQYLLFNSSSVRVRCENNMQNVPSKLSKVFENSISLSPSRFCEAVALTLILTAYLGK